MPTDALTATIARVREAHADAVEQSGCDRWICSDERDDGTAQVYSPNRGPARIIVPVAETSHVCGKAIAEMFNALPTILSTLASAIERAERAEAEAEANENRARLNWEDGYRQNRRAIKAEEERDAALAKLARVERELGFAAKNYTTLCEQMWEALGDAKDENHPGTHVADCMKRVVAERDAAAEKLASTRTVTIQVKEQLGSKEWDVDRYTAYCAYPEVWVHSQSRDAAVNFVKGAVLSAIGMNKELPDEVFVRFEVVDDRQEDADRAGA